MVEPVCVRARMCVRVRVRVRVHVRVRVRVQTSRQSSWLGRQDARPMHVALIDWRCM